MIPAAAVEHYDVQAALAQVVADTAAELWSRVRWADLLASWADLADDMLVVLAIAQQQAAGDADSYVDAALDEQGVTARTAGPLQAGALSGVASDGRDLDDLLRVPVFTAVELAAAGVDRSTAMGQALRQLVRIGVTQVQDAGRVAVGVATAARPDVGGYVRMLNPPSCSRCVILAGRFYRWNAGFQRHPRCDCRHIPAAENVAGDMRTDPGAYFRSLTAEQQDRVFTAAGAQAVRDGSDIGQVVNARRGMYTASVGRRQLASTHEGVTVRGRAGKRVDYRRTPRLMPEQIYEIAGSDRDEAIRLLKRFAYIS